MDNEKYFLDTFKEKPLSPLSIKKEKNFAKSWCTWKEDFISLLKKRDPKELYKNQWTTVLLMLIGPIGEVAYNYISSRNISENEIKDFGTILRDLDLYFIFGSKKRQIGQNIDEYIDSLTGIAITSNHSDPMSVVKEKIIEDIKIYNYIEKALPFVQSKGENLVSYLQSSKLDDVIVFWKQCEQLMLQTNCQKIVKQSSSNSNFVMIQCVRCGTHHNRNMCPAHGVQCNNCKKLNHFTSNCKATYVTDCTKCGTSHIQSRCIAFGVLCTKCGKPNHFSQKCQTPYIKNCIRCGTDHVISACPAQGLICILCNKPNHLMQKCVSKSNNNKKQQQQ